MTRALKGRTRLEAVRRSGLLENAHTIPALNRAARLAARALHAPVGQVNVLTDQFQLPVAVHTEPQEDNQRWRRERRAGSTYCKYVVLGQAPFVVDEASTNRLVRNSRATRELGIVAYLAVPIYSAATPEIPASVLGTLCVIDRVPRSWTSADVEVMTDIAANVTEEIEYRLRSRDEVRAAKQQTMRLLESVDTCILATDANGVTTYANTAALRVLCYTSEELIGHDQHALIHHSHPDGSRYNESDCPNYLARVEGRELRSANDTFWKSDGSPLAVDVVMTPLIDRGEVVGTVLTFEDVSARREAEALERRAREAAEAANNAKSELLAAMSNELRVPASAIGAHANNLERTLLDASAEQRAEVRGIVRSHQHLVGLIENMAGFAKLEVGPDAGDRRLEAHLWTVE